MASDLQGLTDEELARDTRAGSLAAFEELVCRYEHRIYAFVTHCCHNGADAQELTQDTFVKAFQAIAQFDPRRGFAPWLFTIARRKCVDHHRMAPRPTPEELMAELSDPADPSELLALREERENLWQLARRRLPETQFQVLWLRYAEEMSVAGIARVLGKTQTHVRVLLFRARDALGRELKTARAFTTPAVPVAAKPSPGLEGAPPRNQPKPVGVSLGCVVEFPGAVAGFPPGPGKKGLL